MAIGQVRLSYIFTGDKGNANKDFNI
jgi:hypothetical protein